MPATITIRPATLEETDTVRKLWLKLESNKSHHPYGGDVEDEIHARTLDLVTHSITSENALALVAEKNNQVIATLSAYLYEKPAVQLPTIAVLYSLWVEPEHRQQGVAHALLSEVEHRLKQKGAQCLQVAWDSGNRSAEQFWQRSGFEAYEVIASKILK